jgi:hypothetical protein
MGLPTVARVVVSITDTMPAPSDTYSRWASLSTASTFRGAIGTRIGLAVAVSVTITLPVSKLVVSTIPFAPAATPNGPGGNGIGYPTSLSVVVSSTTRLFGRNVVRYTSTPPGPTMTPYG